MAFQISTGTFTVQGDTRAWPPHCTFSAPRSRHCSISTHGPASGCLKIQLGLDSTRTGPQLPKLFQAERSSKRTSADLLQEAARPGNSLSSCKRSSGFDWFWPYHATPPVTTPPPGRHTQVEMTLWNESPPRRDVYASHLALPAARLNFLLSVAD